TAPAGITLLAIHVRFDRTTIAGAHVGHIGAHCHHFHAEFMPRNSRITEERHLAEVAADVGAANTNLVDTDHSFPAAGFFGAGNVKTFPVFGRVEGEGFHGHCLAT